MKQKQCPCHSKKTYKTCCEPLHLGSPAPNALALMRSRYSAYALGKIDYVIATTDPSNPQFNPDLDVWEKELHEFSTRTKFEGLDILSFEDGESVAYVTFKAHLKQFNQSVSFTEKSRFDHNSDQWLYTNGEVSPQ